MLSLCYLKDFDNMKREIAVCEEEVYSTFTLYSSDTFEESLETFKQNIRNNFDDLEKIQWQDENILLQIRK